MGGPDETSWGKVAAIAGVVGVVVAIAAIVVAHHDSHGGQDRTTSPESSLVPPSTSSVFGDASQLPTTYPPTLTDVPSNARSSDPVSEQPPSPSQNLVDTVDVSVDSGNGLILKKGDVYELQPTYPSDINPPYMTFRWSSQGAGGEVDSGDCNVSATIAGPGEYPQRRRDGSCSGRVSPDLKVMEPGVYTVSVDVTPPGGGAPVSGSTSFTVVPHGG